MKESVYIETSVISYLTSRLSRDLIVAGHQKISQSWWEARKNDFDLFISETVLKEISLGDPIESNKRIELVKDVFILNANDSVFHIARSLISEGILPKKAFNDSLHISFSAAANIDYLLTWNCRHLANAEVSKAVAKFLRGIGYEAPSIITPLELFGGFNDDY